MNRTAFRALFEQALALAVRRAEDQLGFDIPCNFQIELHGAGYSGQQFDVDTTLEKLYLGEEQFYRSIDMVVKEVNTRITRVFVGVSGHPPTSYDMTWDPNGFGPFKPSVAFDIKFVPD